MDAGGRATHGAVADKHDYMDRIRLTLFIALLYLSPGADAIELIVNGTVSQQTISKSTLRAIFSMRMTKWSDGIPIKVFVFGDRDPLHASFSKQMLGVFPHQLRYAWNRKIYSGTGQAPIRVKTEQEMRSHVADTPGAIGYLPEDQIDESVRPISID